MNILSGFIGYNAVNKILEFYDTKKLAMNYTALIHSTTASIVWLLGSPSIMICNTGGYFLFDIYYLFNNRELNFAHSLYYYHHIACLYYMSLSPLKYNWFNIIGVAELGNIPNYFVYHYLKTDPHGEKLKRWKMIQKVVYGCIRFIVTSVMAYNELNDPERFWKVLPVVPLFFFGLLWAGVIFSQ